MKIKKFLQLILISTMPVFFTTLFAAIPSVSNPSVSNPSMNNPMPPTSTNANGINPPNPPINNSTNGLITPQPSINNNGANNPSVGNNMSKPNSNY